MKFYEGYNKTRSMNYVKWNSKLNYITFLNGYKKG